MLFFNAFMKAERTGEWSGNFTVTLNGAGRDQPCDLYDFDQKSVRVTIEALDEYDKMCEKHHGMTIGTLYLDYCYECKQQALHKLIAFNKFDNPVYECKACGHFSVDEVNEQDGM